MPTVDCIVRCPRQDSFRVSQIRGMFDLPDLSEYEERFVCEVPGLDEPWLIGAIVGPSGSGKTTIARHVFGRLAGQAQWDDRAVVDNFPADIGIKQIVEVLTSVGLSSPPAWLKPYRVLSQGQQFRCDLARALLSPEDCVVFDEFSSVVDRTVGQVASAAVAKYLRRAGRPRLVAVSCHYDILDWLQPDWVLDMATGRLARRSLRRRPDIRLDLYQADANVWPVFAKHHYLNTRTESLRGCRCIVGCINGSPAAFIAVRSSEGHRGMKRISRVVVLPDYQGIGIGGALATDVAHNLRMDGWRCTITTSHPGMIRALMRTPGWRLMGASPYGMRSIPPATVDRWLRYRSLRFQLDRNYTGSVGRPVCRFEYCGLDDGSQRTGSD